MGEGGGADKITIKTALDAIGFKAGANKLENSVKSLGRNVSKTMSNVSKQGKSVLSTIKKWGPALLGIGGAYSIISKAVNTFMSQNERLSAQFNSIWTALGNVLGPVIEKIITLITDAVSYLLTFLRLLGVTGKSASQLSQSAKKASGDLKRSLAGFDELNVLQEQSSSGGGGGANGSLQDKEAPQWMKDLVDAIKNGEWGKLAQMASDAVIAALNKVADAIRNFPWKKIGAAIREFFLNIKWEEIADAIFNVLKAAWEGAIQLLWGLLAGDTDEKPPIIAALENLGDAFEELYEGAKVVIKALLEDFIKPVFNFAVNDALPVVINFLAEVIRKLGQFCQEHADIIVSVLESIAAFLVAKKIVDTVTSLAGAISAFLTPANLAVIVAIAIGAALIYAYNHSEKFREIVDAVFQWLSKALKDVVKWLKDTWNSIKEWWASFKEDPKAAMKKIGEDIWNGIKEGVGDFLHELYLLFVDPIVQTIDSIKQKLGINGTNSQTFADIGNNILNGLWDGVKGVWDQFTGWLEEKWNSLKTWWENLTLNPFMIKRPYLSWSWEQASGWIADVMEWFGIPAQLPRLNIGWFAKGGLFHKPSIIGVGEEGDEAVVPLENNTEWIDKLATKLISSMQAIANTVSYQTPAMADGLIAPYSVSRTNALQAQESTLGIADVINAISGLKSFLNVSGDNLPPIEFNVYLDGEQIETVVTRRQNQKDRARGR